MKKYCFGVDIGGTTVKIGMFNIDGELLKKWEIPTRKEAQGSMILSDIAESIEKCMEEHKIEKKEIKGIGLGVPGPIMEDGIVLKCVNLGWDVFNVEDKFRELIGIDNIKVANDANVAALGEMWRGGGQGYLNIVMITLGTGVGGGVILNGEILAGVRGAAGEIGHITVNTEEEDHCKCGKCGCLEQYASATGIVKEANRILARTKTPSVLRSVEEFTAKDVMDAAKEGDSIAIKVLEQLGYYLGMACSHIAAVIDPKAFVIGGGVSRAGEILTTKVKEYYEQNVMFALKNKEFCLATLGNDAGIYGCAKMVI